MEALLDKYLWSHCFGVCGRHYSLLEILTRLPPTLGPPWRSLVLSAQKLSIPSTKLYSTEDTFWSYWAVPIKQGGVWRHGRVIHLILACEALAGAEMKLKQLYLETHNA